MKTLSTIQRQIRQLRTLAEAESTPPEVAMKAYEVYHGLRWVIENTSWTPAGLLILQANLVKKEEEDR